MTGRSALCRSAWSIPDGVCYLNHGSFGPTPIEVQAAREAWSRRVASQPMQFFVRELDAALDAAAAALGRFVGASPRDLVFVENATAAMNVVANSLPLAPGDEVLLNDHEYGAVRRIWQRACARQGAKLVTVPLPTPLTSPDDVIEPLRSALTANTRLLVASHVTSPTAVVFPVERLCAIARERGVPVCIDGPHAIAMRPLNLQTLGCTFYCASLHKWLSAPFGSGVLYVDRSWQHRLVPTLWSWGRSLGGRPPRWQDEWNWPGTRDPAAFLAVPAAIEFLELRGVDTFREHGHALARQARHELQALFGTEALCTDSPDWYGTMITVPLPPGPLLREQPNAADPLQQALWDRYQIETLMTDWNGRRHLRASFHLYHGAEDVERLTSALQALAPLWKPAA